MTQKSTPNFFEFNPLDVKYQAKVLRDMGCRYNYKLGTHEVLLSGSIGSAKSLLMAHKAIKHCMQFPRARVLLGRRAMPDLKSTIFKKTLEHLEEALIEDKDFTANHSTASITFRNGSEIITRSWADKHYSKMRSLELSAACIEELSENDDEDKAAYIEIVSRIGRLSHVPEKFIISATNPDSPSHWIYKYFMLDQSPTKHVYYSVTTDNKFLPPEYINKLKETFDPKMVQRMIYGQWIDIAGETIYYQYERPKQYKDYSYEVDKSYPVRLCFDFNIGDGKPMSCAVSQYIKDHWHFYNESVIHSADTSQILEDLLNRNLINKDIEVIVHGDAAGSSRDTRSKTTDYDIIRNFLRQSGIRHQIQVAASNPPIRNRHNIVNGYLCNSENQVRISVYKDAKTVDEGLRLTKLKTGGHYIEDDSKQYQHITTAIGYGIVYVHNNKDRINTQVRF